MDSRLISYLTDLRESGRKGFVPYLLAGFPEKKWTVPLVLQAANAGASAIELGVPFSDPVADGPILQKANGEALKSKINLDEILEMIGYLSKEISIPILLMGYTNSFLQKGWETLAQKASRAGAAGFIIADLPAEEAGDAAGIFQAHGLGVTLLCAPTTKENRMKIIEKNCTGFVYLVAAKGVTGPRESLSGYLVPFIKKVRKHISRPVYVGFGISSPAQAGEVALHADGVIVGSRIASFLEENRSSPYLDQLFFDFLVPWVRACGHVDFLHQ